MLKAFKWVAVGCVCVFVCYHFWPSQTKRTGQVVADKAYRAGKELAK